MGLFSALFGPKHEVLPVHIETEADFKREVTRSEVPVILDVWSDGCVPCRQLAPVMTDVATRYEGRIKVAEVNTSGPIGVLQRLGVTATPTVLIFQDGKELGRVVGYHPRSWFDEMIETEFPDEAASDAD
ncbi:MAG: thioredoxin family protein [Polyangiaceae bacterium]